MLYSLFSIAASIQLSSDWTLMKSGLLDVPTIDDWLVQNIDVSTEPKIIGIDGSVTSYSEYTRYVGKFQTNLQVKSIDEVNLVDQVWNSVGSDGAGAIKRPKVIFLFS